MSSHQPDHTPAADQPFHAHMPGAGQSFRVHMRSLTGFGRELETQLDGLAKPSNDIASIAERPLLLGAFPEAFGLVQTHTDAATQMSDLLGQVKQAIAFCDDVTRTVAGHYAEADSDIARALGHRS